MSQRERQGVEVTWLGQAGFAIRAGDGSLCLLDPYLSDSLREDADNSRQQPVVLDPSRTSAMVVATSHWHQDHLDRVTCRQLLGANPDVRFVGPPANVVRLVDWWRTPAANAIPLRRGETTVVGPFTIRAGHARHEVPGFICEDAISIVVEVDGVRVFHSGDTEYDPLIRGACRWGPIDVALVAINGTGGNMNALEAATLARQLDPRIAIPMHFGMWTDANYGAPDADGIYQPTLDPHQFASAFLALGGRDARILRTGDTLTIDSARAE